MSSKIPDELRVACRNWQWKVGTTKRIKHLHREDGSDCSVGKSAALSVLRKADGWWYHCFRCGLSGFYGDGTKTPEQVESELKALKQEKAFEVMNHISLPFDFKAMTDDPTTKGVPDYAYNWLWKYSLTGEIFKHYNIGWSEGYSRCVVPIYEYAVVGTELAKKLVGWIGRDCRLLTKEERSKMGAAKYILKKSKDYKRVYFHAPAESDTYVIVEDVLSAIKINLACSVNVFALLNTYVPPKLMLRLRHKKVILWLDGDQLENMLRVVAKGSCMGLDISHIHTEQDPKCYNIFAVQQKIKEVK
jgi:hypothetical protein